MCAIKNKINSQDIITGMVGKTLIVDLGLSLFVSLLCFCASFPPFCSLEHQTVLKLLISLKFYGKRK